MNSTVRAIYVSILSLLIGTPAIAASPQTDGIVTSAVEIVKEEGNVRVSFRAEISKRSVPRRYSAMLIPSIVNGGYSWELPPIIVRSGKARIAEARHMWAAGKKVDIEEGVCGEYGAAIEYSATVPYQEWMAGAGLEIGRYAVGCCSTEEMGTVDLAVLRAPAIERQPAVTEEEPDTAVEESAAEEIPGPAVDEPATALRLAEELPLLRPAGEMGSVIGLASADREYALTVFFPQNVYTIQPRVKDASGAVTDNKTPLDNLMRIIREIEASEDSRIEMAIIAGFASPEGSLEVNERLAGRRAESVKEHIVGNTPVGEDRITVYNGGVDWQGLKTLVQASDMADRERIVEIIDSEEPELAGHDRKLAALKRMPASYSYIYRTFFPRLRNAAYIRVYYGTK